MNPGSAESPGLNRAALGPALAAVLVMGLLAAALAWLHGGHLSALMMLEKEGRCYQALGAPPGVAVFPGAGYDGHLFYYIARDLKMEHGCAGAYRYQRILYSALIWLFSLGRESLMPLMMSLINVLAIGAGTWLAARWLAELGISPWLGLFYGLSLGHVVIVQYALCGALALSLALAGAYFFLQRPRPVLAGLFFALALLTRETTVLLAAPLGLWALWRRDWRRLTWLAAALLPYLIWELILWRRFGELPLTSTNAEAVTLNFEGLRALFGDLDFASGWRQALRQASSLPYLAFVLLCLGLGLRGLCRAEGGGRLLAWLVVCNAGPILLLGRGMWTYVSSIGRVSVTLVPAALLLAARSGGATRLWLLGGLGFLFIMGLARVFLAGTHPFFIQPG